MDWCLCLSRYTIRTRKGFLALARAFYHYFRPILLPAALLHFAGSPYNILRMARSKYLPEAFTDIDGNRLKVGQWIIWDSRPTLTSSVSYWQLSEAQPGQYQAVSHARKQTRNFTAKDSRQCSAFPMPLSEKIRLEDYPEFSKRLHDKGIDAFFVTRDVPGVWIQLSKSRTILPLILLPDVKAAKKDISLFEQWLGQLIWIAEHPKQYQILQWIVEKGYANPFGIWPKITPPTGLNRWVKDWQPTYHNYLRQKQLEFQHYAQSLLSPTTPVPGQLPARYRNALNDQYPFVVGEWVSTIHFYGQSIYSPFNDAYLWRLHEPEPGLFTAVGYGVEKTVTLTPENSALIYPLGIKVSERLPLDKYSKYMQLYREKGLAVYFYENAHRDIVLRAIVLAGPAKYMQDIAPLPAMVADMERNPAFLERWLDQMMWCMLNPELGKILFWAMKNGVSFFGNWPALMPPQGLRIAANHLSSLYEADQNRVRTPEELASEKQEITYKTELNEQTILLNKLRLGMLDQSVSPSIDALLDGTGIDNPD